MQLVHKIQEQREPSVATAITSKQFDVMINVPSLLDSGDAHRIRRLAVDNHVPLFTNAETGRLFLRCLAEETAAHMTPKHWREYVPLPKTSRK